MDILLAHGYFLYEDPHELKVMKPYPPLGILYISSYLKSKGFAAGVFDSTFSDMTAFEATVRREQPSVVGIYTNMMTKFSVLRMVRLCRELSIKTVLGGPDPPYYAEEYLRHGADIIVKGEGELTLEALLPHLARHGFTGLETIEGITFMGGDGTPIETRP